MVVPAGEEVGITSRLVVLGFTLMRMAAAMRIMKMPSQFAWRMTSTMKVKWMEMVIVEEGGDEVGGAEEEAGEAEVVREALEVEEEGVETGEGVASEVGTEEDAVGRE